MTRPPRHRDTLTPSQRKNLELSEAVPGSLTLNARRVHLTGHFCGSCRDFPECSQRNVKNAKPTQNYCAWSTRTWRPK